MIGDEPGIFVLRSSRKNLVSYDEERSGNLSSWGIARLCTRDKTVTFISLSFVVLKPAPVTRCSQSCEPVDQCEPRLTPINLDRCSRLESRDGLVRNQGFAIGIGYFLFRRISATVRSRSRPSPFDFSGHIIIRLQPGEMHLYLANTAECRFGSVLDGGEMGSPHCQAFSGALASGVETLIYTCHISIAGLAQSVPAEFCSKDGLRAQL